MEQDGNECITIFVRVSVMHANLSTCKIGHPRNNLVKTIHFDLPRCLTGEKLK